MSNLIDHAKRELELLGNDKDFDDAILKAVEGFASYGHSGGSASYAIPLLNDLLSFKNISPLTNDPEEWMEVDENLWQSRRNPSCFSDNGGKTFWDNEDSQANMMYSVLYIAKDPEVHDSEEKDTDILIGSNDVAEAYGMTSSTIPVNHDISTRLNAWMSAEKIVADLAMNYELKEVKNSISLGSSTTWTPLEQHIDHIRTVAEWLLEGGD